MKRIEVGISYFNGGNELLNVIQTAHLNMLTSANFGAQREVMVEPNVHQNSALNARLQNHQV